MGLVIVLIVVGLAILGIGWVRAHPKPADEPLETYVEDVAKGVEEEIVSEVKKVVRKSKSKTPTTTDKS